MSRSQGDRADEVRRARIDSGRLTIISPQSFEKAIEAKRRVEKQLLAADFQSVLQVTLRAGRASTIGELCFPSVIEPERSIAKPKLSRTLGDRRASPNCIRYSTRRRVRQPSTVGIRN